MQAITASLQSEPHFLPFRARAFRDGISDEPMTHIGTDYPRIRDLANFATKQFSAVIGA